jgi:NitT/TauT family transport system substrate-binding protein
MKLNVGIDLRTLTRREFMGTLVKGGIVAAGSALVPWRHALAQAKLNVGTMRIGDLSPFFIGIDRGFFKDAGLEINTTAMVGGAAIAPALASGALNLGWSNVVSIYQGHLQGFDYRFVVNGAINKRETNDEFGLLVRADFPAKTGKDLEGKTMATNTLRNITQLMGLHWVDNNGGNSSRTKWVEIPFPQMEPALVNQQIDAFVAVEPFVTVPSKVNKKARVLGRPASGVAPRLLIASYFGSEAWIRKNPDAVKAFINAYNRGIDAHNAEVEKAKVSIAKHTGLKPELLKEMPLPAFEKKLLESDLQPMLDVAYHYKLIDRKFPAKQVISEYAPA